MTLKLVKVRRCDGKCCEESPRFPTTDHSDCIYHKSLDGKESSGCMLMTGERTIPDGDAPIWPNQSAAITFKETCVDWPHNIPNPRVGETGGCCWQFVDDGN